MAAGFEQGILGWSAGIEKGYSHADSWIRTGILTEVIFRESLCYEVNKNYLEKAKFSYCAHFGNLMFGEKIIKQ